MGGSTAGDREGTKEKDEGTDIHPRQVQSNFSAAVAPTTMSIC